MKEIEFVIVPLALIEKRGKYVFSLKEREKIEFIKTVSLLEALEEAENFAPCKIFIEFTTIK